MPLVIRKFVQLFSNGKGGTHLERETRKRADIGSLLRSHWAHMYKNILYLNFNVLINWLVCMLCISLV